MVRNFLDLKIWQKAHQLTINLYALAKNFPATEQYGLASQIRRSSSSIGANIAEGCGQHTSKAIKRYLFLAYGSLQELKYHILLAKDVGYIVSEKFEAINNDCILLSKMIYAFINKMPSNTRYLLPDA
jgi:four helix bundle protein